MTTRHYAVRAYACRGGRGGVAARKITCHRLGACTTTLPFGMPPASVQHFRGDDIYMPRPVVRCCLAVYRGGRPSTAWRRLRHTPAACPQRGLTPCCRAWCADGSLTLSRPSTFPRPVPPYSANTAPTLLPTTFRWRGVTAVFYAW